jgi:hypothetical protein
MEVLTDPPPPVSWRLNMPIPVATGQIVQVLVQGSIEEQQCENVWYFRALAVDPDMLLHLLADVATCVLALIPSLGSTYRLERIKGKVVSPVLGAEEEWIPAPGADVEGASAGDTEPSFVSALISLHTTRGGRSGRGRIYIAGVPESQTIGSKINRDLALWAALAAFVACMLDKFKSRDVPVAGQYDWGVMSRKLGSADPAHMKPPFLAVGYAQIVRAVVKEELATTRSRKLGHGR